MTEKNDTKPIEEKAGEAKPAPKPRRKQKWKPQSVAPGRQKGSAEAKKSAAAVLEVLGGERRPSEAAAALGVSMMRYYVIESRALQGLLEACEPRPIGPRVDPQKQVARLMRQMDNLQRDVVRYQALARASHRTLGIAPVNKDSKTKRGKRRRRTPAVRALKAAAGFRKDAPAAAASQPAGEATTSA